MIMAIIFYPLILVVIFLSESSETIIIILSIVFLLSVVYSNCLYKLNLSFIKFNIKYLDYINIILRNRSYKESYHIDISYPGCIIKAFQQEIPFFEEIRKRKAVIAPLNIRFIRFTCSLISSIIVTALTTSLNIIFSKGICGLIIIATFIIEFCSSLIFYHPYVSGVQSIMRCEKENNKSSDEEEEDEFEEDSEEEKEEDSKKNSEEKQGKEDQKEDEKEKEKNMIGDQKETKQPVETRSNTVLSKNV